MTNSNFHPKMHTHMLVQFHPWPMWLNSHLISYFAISLATFFNEPDLQRVTKFLSQILYLFFTSYVLPSNLFETNSQGGGPSDVGHLRLLIQYICNYPTYLDVTSSIHKLRMCHDIEWMHSFWGHNRVQMHKRWDYIMK